MKKNSLKKKQPSLTQFNPVFFFDLGRCKTFDNKCFNDSNPVNPVKYSHFALYIYKNKIKNKIRIKIEIIEDNKRKLLRKKLYFL